MEAEMKRVRFLGALVTVCVAASAAVAGASGSAGSAVRGVQTPVYSGPCFDPAAFASYTMGGDLVGCWYIDTIALTGLQPSGTVELAGTEHFVGCLDRDANAACGAGDPTGTFATTFTFTGKYDASGNELHGRCHHPIVSGTGGFATVSGVIDFVDDVSTGCASYTGSVRL
jgi:hypothetical protein